MSRIPLKKGDIVMSPKEKYVIQSVIGDGATGIVYDAIYYDSINQPHTVRLKESYPYTANVKRKDTNLVWETVQEKELALNKFVAGYSKLMQRQNSNFVVHAFDLFEANGTTYIVMDANDGVTFDKDNSTSLGEILKTVKLLAHVVGEYHKNGYLHLDIKPSNFLVYPRPSEHIVLFDVDSVTAIDDIKSGVVQCVSYSKGWAAPEQMQGRLDKIGPTTDIYAIGAVLFEKIMGRAVSNEDIGVFAEWEFNGGLFEKVNPKIKRLLRSIFRKTLSANLKKRYQTIDELIVALDEAIYTIREGAPYLISDCPLPRKNFLGREDELQTIANIFTMGKRIVFLHGVGGIGKSELAKSFAKNYAKKYDAILYLEYKDSLRDVIEEIEIQNFDDNNKIKGLKRIFKEQKILLIIDNFDIAIDEDEYLSEFLRFNIDIIFTTRTDFRECAFDNVVQIEIGELSKSELISLFEKESGLDIAKNSENKRIICDILKKIDYYTLLVPMLARQMIASAWTLEALYKKVANGLTSFEQTEKISISKDGKIYKRTGLDIMRAIFRVFELTEIQKEIMINFYLLRGFVLNKEQYRKYLLFIDNKAIYIDAINELLELGWLRYKGERVDTVDPSIDIHPIIQEMIEIELQPTIMSSPILLDYIQFYVPWSKFRKEHFDGEELDELSTLEKDLLVVKLKWFCRFVNTLNLKTYQNMKYITNALFELLNGNLYTFDLFDSIWEFKHGILEKIENYIKQDLSIENEMLLKIYSILEIRYLSTLRFVNFEYREEKLAEKYFSLFNSHIDISTGNDKVWMIWLLCKPVIQLINQYSLSVPQSVYRIVKKHETTWKNHYNIEKYWDKLSDEYREYTKKQESFMKGILPDVGMSEEDARYLDAEAYYTDKFLSGIEVSLLNKELLNDSTLSNNQKHSIYYHIVWRVCYNISYPGGDMAIWWQKFRQQDWNRVLEILSYQEDFYINNKVSSRTAYRCDAYRVVLYALQEEGDEKAKHYLTFLMEEFNLIFKQNMYNTHWSRYTDFDAIRTHALFDNIGMCFDMLDTINRCDLAVEPLIECANLVHNYIKSLSEYSENMMYSWYKTIEEFSTRAQIYTDNEELFQKYWDIEKEYLSKIERMIGKDFDINEVNVE